MAQKPVYQEVLENILKALVNHPDELKIEKSVDEMGVLLTVKANKDDVGLIIGKNGTTVRAIKMVIKRIGAKNKASVNIKIEQPAEASSVDKIIDELKK